MKKLNISADTAINLVALLLRLAAALMLLHGFKKLTNFGKLSGEFPDPLHVGHTFSLALTVFAEFFCTLFVVAGLFTRIALVPLLICMFVIVLIIHAPDPFSEKESGLIYLLIYLSLFFTGPGKYSLDRLLLKK